MGIKAYQPHRKDLLINTEWGIPKKEIPKEEAGFKNLKLFHRRWVTEEEKRRLKREHFAYQSIRSTAYILIFVVPFIFILALMAPASVPVGGRPTPLGDIVAAIVLPFSVVSITSGIGLLRYRRWARIVATAVLFLMVVPGFFLVLPAILGIMGLYALYNKTARRIFNPLVTY